jgi:hypothetical protein
MANNPSDEDEGVADLDSRLIGMQLTGDAMLVDHLEEVDEKQEVAVISPDGSVDDSDLEQLADDCMFDLIHPGFWTWWRED